MADTLVDTSVALKWVLEEPDSQDAEMKLARVTVRGERLYMLDLGLFEAANGIVVQFRQKHIDEAFAQEAWERLKNAPVSIVRSEPIADIAFAIAMKYKIASYDAAYVAMVQQLNCEGVTADVPLYKAVGKDFPSIKLLKDW